MAASESRNMREGVLMIRKILDEMVAVDKTKSENQVLVLDTAVTPEVQLEDGDLLSDLVSNPEDKGALYKVEKGKSKITH